VQSMDRRFVDSLQAVGDSLSKISTNCMKYGYVVLLFTCPCYDFIIYVTMIACVHVGNFL
jgi:hypothetical protein